MRASLSASPPLSHAFSTAEIYEAAFRNAELAQQALAQLGREVKKDTKVPRGQIAMCHLFDLSGVEGLEEDGRFGTRVPENMRYISSRSFTDCKSKALEQPPRCFYFNTASLNGLVVATASVAPTTRKYKSQDILSGPLSCSEGLLADRGVTSPGGISPASSTPSSFFFLNFAHKGHTALLSPDLSGRSTFENP